MRPVPKIFSDMGKSIGASGFQFALTLITTPIMTRLYAPEAYATFGLLQTLAGTLVGIGLLSLPHAYLTEKDPTARAPLMRLMLLMLVALCALSGIIAARMAMDARYATSHVALALLPLMVLCYGVRQLLMMLATDRAHFSGIALGQVIEPLFARGGSIGLGALFGGHPAFILLSGMVGQISMGATLLLTALKGARGSFTHLLSARARPLPILRRYADFVFFNTASQQTTPLVMLGIQLAIVAHFSGTLAGHYILAISILSLPGTLIALTTAPIIFRHMVDLQNTAPQKMLHYYLRSIALYGIAGIVCLSPLFFFGEALFSLAFGDVWEEAGRIASSLSLAYVGMFTVLGVQAVFLVMRRLKWSFAVDACCCVLILALATFAFEHLSFTTAIDYLAGVWILRSLLLLGAGAIAATHAHAPVRVAA